MTGHDTIALSTLVRHVGGACRRGGQQMSASLIGPSGSSTFRLSIAAVSMSPTGSRFSSESRH